MNAHYIKLSNGTETYTGKIIVTDDALIFLCSHIGSALLDGAKIGLFGAKGNRGWLFDAFDSKNASTALPAEVNSDELKNIASEMKGSIVFDATKIEIIKQNWLVKMIKWDGKKIGVPSGFSNSLIKELLPLVKKWNIKTAGI